MKILHNSTNVLKNLPPTTRVRVLYVFTRTNLKLTSCLNFDNTKSTEKQIKFRNFNLKCNNLVDSVLSKYKVMQL